MKTRILILFLVFLLVGCATLRLKPYAELLSFDTIKLRPSVKKYLGTPYRRGGNTTKGIDCSGLVVSVFKEQGVGLPRTVKGLLSAGREVLAAKPKFGDLVFFKRRLFSRTSHVGIYFGKGKFVHASSSKGVTMSNFYSSYWQRRCTSIRRVAKGK